MGFMQTESVLQSKNRSGPAKNRFSVALFRSVCLFWSKQATNILKNIKILLLMVQLHNATSEFTHLASGDTELAIRAHNLFQNNGEKKKLFSQN